MKKVTKSQYNKITKKLGDEYMKAKKRETNLYFKKCTNLWTNYNKKLNTYEVSK